MLLVVSLHGSRLKHGAESKHKWLKIVVHNTTHWLLDRQGQMIDVDSLLITDMWILCLV